MLNGVHRDNHHHCCVILHPSCLKICCHHLKSHLNRNCAKTLNFWLVKNKIWKVMSSSWLVMYFCCDWACYSFWFLLLNYELLACGLPFVFWETCFCLPVQWFLFWKPKISNDGCQ